MRDEITPAAAGGAVGVVVVEAVGVPVAVGSGVAVAVGVGVGVVVADGWVVEVGVVDPEPQAAASRRAEAETTIMPRRPAAG
jgi:hypothetical protein